MEKRSKKVYLTVSEDLENSDYNVHVRLELHTFFRQFSSIRTFHHTANYGFTACF